MPIATINPATGETVKTFTAATDDEVDAAIARPTGGSPTTARPASPSAPGGPMPPPTCWKPRPTRPPR